MIHWETRIAYFGGRVDGNINQSFFKSNEAVEVIEATEAAEVAGESLSM